MTTTRKEKKHIHDDPRIDCPACVEFIRAPLPKVRVMPLLELPVDKKRRELFEKMVDYEYSKVKSSKTLRTPFGTLVWTPKES